MAQSVLDHFIQQVAYFPEKLAIVSNNKHITYRQLDDASNQLCGRLQQQGISPGGYVPLVALRTPELLIGMLAIIKAGASYIPIDAQYPEKRIQDIVRQSASKTIILSNLSIDFEIKDSSINPLVIDNITSGELLPFELIKPNGDATAYIIFTSGTTGSPKGVMIEHHSLLNIVLWHNQKFAMDHQSRSTLMAGIGFDVAQWEIWAALTSGGTLYLPDEETRLQPSALLNLFAHHQITHAFVPTVLVADIVNAPQPENLALRYLFTAGEKLNPVDLSRVNYPLVDYYGPTEATIFASWNPVSCATQHAPATIGRPVADTEIFILDDKLQPVSDQQPGELYISGSCLARGYLNNPQLTAEKFITPPHFAGKRLYRSGDRARWLPDQRIQFLGRIDDQIKIRGNRVELGEIESIMAQVAGVKAAVAIVTQPQDPANKQIVAFLVADKNAPELLERVKQRLKETLPSYFLPADYLLLERLPINANGKTDKAALLALSRPAQSTVTETLTGRRQAIATLWRNLLGIASIHADDNFFDVGGHSLLAAKLVTAIDQQLGIKVYVRDIYEYPTINRLAQALDERSGHALPTVDSEPVRALQDDVWLPEGVTFNPDYDLRQISSPKAILLTGATGFVGAHLLAELLTTTRAELHCLVRDRHQQSPQRRLDEILARYQIALSAEQRARIHLIPGDVAEQDFALPPERYAALSQQVDIIYHSASAVNFIQPYSYMKRDNVQGLREIIRFAAHQRTKPLMLLSTISVYSWGHLHTGKRVMRESDDIDQNLPAVITDIGYVRSKWVMEKIADLAASQGLPLMTFRLGYATCHSRTGVSASYQWWGRLVKTCIASGTLPALQDLREGLTTVDYMTQAIAHVSRNPQALGKKFNLIHQHQNNLTLQDFFSLLEREFGYRFRPLPFEQWRAQWEHNGDAPLYPLLSLFRDNMVNGQSTVQLYQNTYQWDCSNLKYFLQHSGIEEPRFTRQMLLNYLRQSIGTSQQSLQV
ncbi:Linear gramicidin synthase subunit D [Serratia proteamaculans]|uniref:amino acid adenylation domain-containing protein n=1 Tax=Serratia proteamaculans TaxID=28151 RepID=UPI00217B2A64|nr:amino acid adenylation domain-containing protein [Serratia proteamaculans]CAI1759526.1 Linear gramicidin synthase subunit D [Serratia proteamaculans]